MYDSPSKVIWISSNLVSEAASILTSPFIVSSVEKDPTRLLYLDGSSPSIVIEICGFVTCIVDIMVFMTEFLVAMEFALLNILKTG